MLAFLLTLPAAERSLGREGSAAGDFSPSLDQSNNRLSAVRDASGRTVECRREHNFLKKIKLHVYSVFVKSSIEKKANTKPSFVLSGITDSFSFLNTSVRIGKSKFG